MLGLTQTDLGEILAIADPGICRWEGKGTGEVVTDGIRGTLLDLLSRKTEQESDPEQYGKMLLETARSYGSSYAVYRILDDHYSVKQ